MSEHQHGEPETRKWTARSIWRGVLDHAPATIVLGFLALWIRHLFVATPFWAWAADNEVSAIAAAGFVIFVEIVTRPISGFIFAKLRIYFVARQVVRSCGLESFWPHTPDAKGRGWEGCIAEFEATPPENIRILAFTGANTFSTKGSPLYEVLKDHRGNIEILLAQPDTPAFNQRLEQLREKLDRSRVSLKRQCQEELDESIEYCNTLQSSAPEVDRIEVRQYDSEPIWKMIIRGHYLWLQYYRPGQPNDEMPAYGFRKSADSSLAYPLQRVFDSLWALSANRVLFLWQRSPALSLDARSEHTQDGQPHQLS